MSWNPYTKYNDENTLNPDLNVTLSSLNTAKSALNDAAKNYKLYNNSSSGNTDNANSTDNANNTDSSGSNSFSNYMAKGAAVVGGIANLYNTYQELSKISDTSQQWDAISEIDSLGTRDYTDFDQLINDYSSLDSMNKSFKYRDIRGKSDGQMAMGVGNAMLQGAAAGASFGPYGAAAGAVIGLGTGIAGVASGNAAARLEKLRLENGAKMASANARDNLAAANEGIAEYKFRAGVSRRAAWGGQIERKQQDIKEFATKALKRPQMKEHTPSKRFVRSHTDGGTVVRIKR